jgi:hypothetical protein
MIHLPALLFLALAVPSAGDQNLIVNGSFEEWRDLDPAILAADWCQVDLTPPGRAPTSWMPTREQYKGMGHTASLTMDEAVKHSGARSVRIHNADMRDITYVQFSTDQFVGHPDDAHNIKPNRRYMVRWWVKGEEVATGGTGPIMMMYVSSRDGGQERRAYTYELEPTLPLGTFDWLQRRFVFITDPQAVFATFTFQLRWTTGTIWYDDVELLDLGPVVPVETY